jgi:cytidylate kinase
MHSKTTVRIITIDGPSGSGKGTVAAQVADRLGWTYLDSGSLYRLTALSAMRSQIPFESEIEVSELAKNLNVQFLDRRIIFDHEDVTDAIRTEAIGEGASIVSKLPMVRAALLERQRNFADGGIGLVTDGRDMGSEVFPHADLKIFLTASIAERAKRRHHQLSSKGISADYDEIFSALAQRDFRDSNRSISPLFQADDTRLLDTTNLSVEQAIHCVLQWWKEKEISL